VEEQVEDLGPPGRRSLHYGLRLIRRPPVRVKTPLVADSQYYQLMTGHASLVNTLRGRRSILLLGAGGALTGPRRRITSSSTARSGNASGSSCGRKCEE